MDKNKYNFREHLYEIIFESKTFEGKLFDISMIVAIVISLTVIILESVPGIRANYQELLRILEWVFTIIFTVEYLLRIYASKNRKKYILSFFGIVDLISIVPSYMSLFIPGANYLLSIRSLRILRIFKILELSKLMSEADYLRKALNASKNKISVFLFTILTLVIILGSVMYMVEGEEHGFTSIPISIYWAIVTLTTVGYGDISPKTPLGQFISCIVMIMGYGIIAVPTGIVTISLSEVSRNQEIENKKQKQKCINCTGSNDFDALYCKYCGKHLS